MRPIWKGAISFGLVHIPVKLYPATEQKNIKFNYLHEKCKTPIAYAKKCPTCDYEVPAEEIVRGYEYEKGRYVIMREEDFDRIPLETTKTIDIMDFVDSVEIDPIFFSKSYYITPSDGGQKPYELLRQAMDASGKIAVAKLVLRTNQSLAALRINERAILMETMFYPDEIRSLKYLPELDYQVNIHENEVKMDVSLIGSLSAKFQPEKYVNEYRDALWEIIQAKIEGKEVAVPEPPEVGKVVDLMEALKASIELAKEEKARREKNEVAEQPKKARKRKTS